MTTPQRRILLVEDHPDTQNFMRRFLRHWGFDVRTASTAREAAEAAHIHPFDVLICDLGLPDSNGWQLLAELQPLRATRPFRAIALSGHAYPDDVRQSLAAGFESHLAKPVDLSALRNLLLTNPAPQLN